jgi:sugar/nucleoside kinase (ribokinase family)
MTEHRATTGPSGVAPVAPASATDELDRDEADSVRATPDIVLIGQATIDDIHREDGYRSLNTPGGAVLYATVGASMWPVTIGVVTRFGDDYDPSFSKQASANPEATDWSGVSFLVGESIRDVATYHRDGSRTYRFRSAHRLHELTPVAADIPPHMLGARYVHLAPASLGQQLHLLDAIRPHGPAITLDTERHFIRADRDLVNPLLAGVDFFVPSLEHLQMIFESEDANPRSYWPFIRELGPAYVVCKWGVFGSYVFDVKRRLGWHVGVVHGLTIEDETGAGDAFCGGFLAGLILSGDVVTAAAYGSVSSSFVLESLGARVPGHFTRELATRRLEQVVRTIPAEPELLD